MAPHTSSRDEKGKHKPEDTVQVQKGHAVAKKEVPKYVMNKPLPPLFNPQELRNLNKQEEIILEKVVIYAIPIGGPYRGKTRLHWVSAFEVVVEKREKPWFVFIDTAMDGSYIKKYKTMALPVLVRIKKTFYKYREDSPDESRFECPLKRNIALRDVYSLIFAKGLINYRYTKEGNGCFYWIKTFFNALIEKEWLLEDEAKKVNEKLRSFKKNQLIGKDHIISGDEGQFFVADDDED